MSLTSVFASVLAECSEEDRSRVRELLATMEGDTDLDKGGCQVVDNIKMEASLSARLFNDLLVEFSRLYSEGKDWTSVVFGACCKVHAGIQRGPIVDYLGNCVFGRAIEYEPFWRSFLKAYRKVGGRLTARAIRKKFEQFIDCGNHSTGGRDQKTRSDYTYIRDALEICPMGRFVVWATFNEVDPSDHPFRFPMDIWSHVRCCLGLGHIDSDAQIMLLAYRSPSVFNKPTIVEAKESKYFRPSQASDSVGRTYPLFEGDEIEGKPEIVHGVEQKNAIVYPVKFASL